MTSNENFLRALFGDDAPFAHVTDFSFDPAAIPPGQELRAWAGNYACRYGFTGTTTNQYFAISVFGPDSEGKARRQKALYLRTPVIVLDDVREKLSVDAAKSLPEPTWVLETSPGSEQWGYLLQTPATDRGRVENLLDGLVANGLAPDGKDPGMKGVTRYVRLPGGYNLKRSKFVDGLPFKCRLLHWSPFTVTTLEALATPFHVDLDAARRDQRVDGAGDIPDNPLLHLPGVIQMKDKRSDGRFEITCPWVEGHTNQEDSGAAIFTNDDGSFGFKCHHGSCEHRTGNDLMAFIETHSPGFNERYTQWRVTRMFKEGASGAPSPGGTATTEAAQSAQSVNSLDDLFAALQREPYTGEDARRIAGQILQLVDKLPAIDKHEWHRSVSDQMRWTKTEFSSILKDLRSQWYNASRQEVDFFNDAVYVKELNQFFEFRTGIFYTPEAYQNANAHMDEEARKTALVKGKAVKVDRLDYLPKQPRVFEENGIVYGNSWDQNSLVKGVPGDPTPWLNHFDVLGWENEKGRVLQWMAHTIQHPETKINHMMLLGSGEGAGKDFLLYPMLKAMGENATIINGEELLGDFNDYLLSTKLLHVNETELGNRQEALRISSKLKPYAAAPPQRLSVNPKGVKRTQIRNIMNVTMTTNSKLPLRLEGPSRRVYALWSYLDTRDKSGQVTPEWIEYWRQHWGWMLNGGAEACIHHLETLDVSKFNPGAPPIVTDFAKEIQEGSKSSTQLAIEEYIRQGFGPLAADLFTLERLTSVLRAQCWEDNSSTNRFGSAAVLSSLQTIQGARLLQLEDGTPVWAIRNAQKYAQMGVVSLTEEYERQVQKVAASSPLTVVK